MKVGWGMVAGMGVLFLLFIVMSFDITGYAVIDSSGRSSFVMSLIGAILLMIGITLAEIKYVLG